MKYQEKIEITLHVPKEIFDKVLQIVSYLNTYDQLHKTNEEHLSVENFIIGSINDVIENIENFYPSALNQNISFEDTKLENNLKGYLQRNKIKQIDLAEWTQLDPTTISLIVKNRNQPTLDHFLRIWAVLGFPPIDELVYRVPK
jgi:DNA-binding XRE family transcriptional regulator